MSTTPDITPDQRGNYPQYSPPQYQSYPPPPYQQYPPPPYQPYPQVQERQGSTNGLAIASMVLGILCLYGVGSVLALIFGYVAKNQIAESHGRQQGRGMAIAGIVLGWLGVALMLLIFLAVAVASHNASPGG